MSSALPIHSEKTFRRYETYIAAIVNSYPQPITVSAATLSVNTLIARIRDSLNGMRLNGWKSNLFTYADCQKVFALLNSGGQWVLTVQNNSVYAGPRLEDNGALVEEAQVIVKASHGMVDARDLIVFNAFTVLKSRGFITDPVKFVNVSSEQVEHMQTREELEFFEESDDVYIML